MSVSTRNADHYLWGERCDGWRLLNGADLSVTQERMPPGASEKPHLHARARQFFFVLEGEAELEAAGTAHRLAVHEGLEVPPGTPHVMRNPGPGPLTFLVISSPDHRGDRSEL